MRARWVGAELVLAEPRPWILTAPPCADRGGRAHRCRYSRCQVTRVLASPPSSYDLTLIACSPVLAAVLGEPDGGVALRHYVCVDRFALGCEGATSPGWSTALETPPSRRGRST
jgi:hypothetical protein